MDYGKAELCSECGDNMFIMPNPSQSMLESSPGYSILKETVTALNDRFDPRDTSIAFCYPCGVTALIGPKVSISGIVVGET